jgi:hypothetical protein
MAVVGCTHQPEGQTSIYDSAFTLTLPADVKNYMDSHLIFGDEVRYWNIFNNKDSTIKVDIEITKDTTRLSEDLIPPQIDGLRHFDPNMVVLKKGILKQKGVEMLSIVYEIPLVRSFHGYIVERRVFLTTKGRATVDITCRFDNMGGKGKSMDIANKISNSINVPQ